LGAFYNTTHQYLPLKDVRGCSSAVQISLRIVGLGRKRELINAVTYRVSIGPLLEGITFLWVCDDRSSAKGRKITLNLTAIAERVKIYVLYCFAFNYFALFNFEMGLFKPNFWNGLKSFLLFDTNDRNGKSMEVVNNISETKKMKKEIKIAGVVPIFCHTIYTHNLFSIVTKFLTFMMPIKSYFLHLPWRNLLNLILRFLWIYELNFNIY